MRFRLDQLSESGSDELLEECRKRSGDTCMDDAVAAVFILKEIWAHLWDTHKIRIVK